MSGDHYTKVLEVLTEYVSVRLLGEGKATDLTPSTRLLDLGLLNSIETSRLVAYIRETFGVRLPPTSMTAGNFQDLESITALVISHGPDPAATLTNGDARA
jgi:acyl carrier protein